MFLLLLFVFAVLFSVLLKYLTISGSIVKAPKVGCKKSNDCFENLRTENKIIERRFSLKKRI